MKRIATVIAILVLCPPGIDAAPLSIRYFQTDQRYSYRIELLKLALDKTVETAGPYVLEPVEGNMTQARGLAYLQGGHKINVAFLPTSVERERRFLPVKIPMLRGILGYRVFLIHRDLAGKFSAVDTLDQLNEAFKAGFGAHWADIVILRHNNIPVDKTAEYELLFAKLEKKRFDYFPRGINEAWREIAVFSEKYPDLMIEPHLGFYYPYPVYFFVNKQNRDLASRIEKGLTLALDDGAFKSLFLAFHQEIIRRAGLVHRKLFRLENPTLPAGTPEPDTSWWLKFRER